MVGGRARPRRLPNRDGVACVGLDGICCDGTCQGCCADANREDNNTCTINTCTHGICVTTNFPDIDRKGCDIGFMGWTGVCTERQCHSQAV